MPYFIILPVYVLLVFTLLFGSVVLLFIPQWRKFSSYLVCGAIGTLPGFVLGNALFWLIGWAVLTLVHKPIQQATSEFANGAAAVALVVFVVAGLSIANVGGCVIGFLAGVWAKARFFKK